MDVSELHNDISNEDRIAAIEGFLLDDVVTAPAHGSLRDPGAVRRVSHLLAAGGAVSTDAAPITLNVITETADTGAVGLVTVECLDGHHRLVAFRLAGLGDRIGHLQRASLIIRVNGWPVGGSGPLPRWIPLGAAERSRLPRDAWTVVDSPLARGPTAEIDGTIHSLDERFAPEDRGVPIGTLVGALREGD